MTGLLALTLRRLTGDMQTWLNPSLPLRTEQTICDVCGARMDFLMQINAPLDEVQGRHLV